MRKPGRVRGISDIVANILMVIVAAIFGFIVVSMFLNTMYHGTSIIEHQSEQAVTSLEQYLGLLASFIDNTGNATVIVSAGETPVRIRFILVDGEVASTVYINDKLVDMNTGEGYVVNARETTVIKIPCPRANTSTVTITIVYDGGVLDTVAKRLA